MKYILAILTCLFIMPSPKSTLSRQVFIRVFKEEKELEVWINIHGAYKLAKVYDICKLSGKAGPKTHEGDLQVPEGVYKVVSLNPHSRYSRAIGINYPNGVDSLLSKYKNKGGAIFIHGDCVSVGCIAIGNKAINELFDLVSTSTQTTVHIFPARYDQYGGYINQTFSKSTLDVILFEKNLEDIYMYFEKTKKLPEIYIDSAGYYKIKPQFL